MSKQSALPRRRCNGLEPAACSPIQTHIQVSSFVAVWAPRRFISILISGVWTLKIDTATRPFFKFPFLNSTRRHYHLLKSTCDTGTPPISSVFSYTDSEMELNRTCCFEFDRKLREGGKRSCLSTFYFYLMVACFTSLSPHPVVDNIIRNTERDFRGDFYSPRPWIATEAGG